MPLLLRQIWALTIKNLRITLLRHWLATPLRALLVPILIVLILSFAEDLVTADAYYGLGEARPIRSLQSSVNAAGGGRDRIVLISGGFSDGAIEAVINDLVHSLNDTDIKVVKGRREEELRDLCTSSSGQGTSKCIAAVVFNSSPAEGLGGIWNYTLRADGALGGETFVDKDDNDAQIYTLPIQRAVEYSIAKATSGPNGHSFDATIYERPLTSQTDKQKDNNNRILYMNMVADILSTAFYLALACIIYHATGFIATEREMGMSKLLDTMMPNITRWHTQAARLASYHFAFDTLYGPGWVTTGAILGSRIFPHSSVLIPLLFHVFAGLSTTSVAIFFGCFFRKAQMSGIISIIIALAFAIVAQLSSSSSTGVTVVLALLFPPMNYIFFLVNCTRWEREGRAHNLLKGAPSSSFSVPSIAFFFFAVLQMFIFSIIGAGVEALLHGTASKARKMTVSQTPVALELENFCKEYSSGAFARWTQCLTRSVNQSVRAVDNLSLQAMRGEILVLLGANGSGKSTTLDAIAGQHSISSGKISLNYLDPQEGFGYCPQKNILWDDLTVSEHVKIFDQIKNISGVTSPPAINDLIAACDLSKKAKGLSKSLSGGQKRKLQMAMMFAGGSTICCIDEVSSGVDPLSRRKLWDILLSARGRRSIILTTHFLDEADLLADRIAILSKGSLKASGTSMELKHRLGTGYRVHLLHPPDTGYTTSIYDDVLHTNSEHGSVYYPGSSAETSQFLKRLDADGVQNYDVKGPTLEDVFFQVEERSMSDSRERPLSEPKTPLVGQKGDAISDLQRSKRVNIFGQVLALLSKRFTVFWRNPVPYVVAFCIPVIAAGCSTLLLKNTTLGYCDPADAPAIAGNSELDDTSYSLLCGPATKLSLEILERLSHVPAKSIIQVDTFEEFNQELQTRFTSLTPGGFFLGDDESTIAWRADGSPEYAHVTQNLLSSQLFNTTIATNYELFDVPAQWDTKGILLFIICFGLSMAVFPAFLALYPTIERIRGIRAMQYSNGVRAMPLWSAYLLFDFTIMLVISIITVSIFAGATNVGYALGYFFLILLLYGVASTLWVYFISLFSKSQLAAFAIAAGSQAVPFLIYFIVFVKVFTNAEPSQQTPTMNVTYFTLGLLSPVVSLVRSMYFMINAFGVSCRDKRLASYPGAIDLYGGPILYLILQSIGLFIFLFLKETNCTLWSLFRRRTPSNNEIELEASTDYASHTTNGLRVMGLNKKYGKHTAVDNVSFGIPRSTCFALVGPNGAGKSTTISMIRGDIRPSSAKSHIYIDGVSAIEHSARSRARLGVCPQIDPLDSITVSEHLYFYAQIRGLVEPKRNIMTIMEAVGITQYQDRIATKLSGGNKRKLVLAIALVGNPSVLLLDEPSSGMDAVSMRLMWKTLSSLTPGRSLLLTTHSMEEADALASRAGVVAGRMLAQGSMEELRRQWGNSYFVHLSCRHGVRSSNAEMNRIRSWAAKEFPDAIFEDWMSYGQVKFQIPIGGPRSLAGIFGRLEANKEYLGVQYYNVSTATLDQIFLAVVGRHLVQEEGE